MTHLIKNDYNALKSHIKFQNKIQSQKRSDQDNLYQIMCNFYRQSEYQNIDYSQQLRQHNYIQQNNKQENIQISISINKQKMQKKPNSQKDKIVSLQELISQPECLKLLILHTPFTLNLQSLPLCINLVKLDLSKNNLTSFPYLGDLPSLKFMFIHENKLEIDALIGIFQQDLTKDNNEKSILSLGIIWVTYWGNKNQFSARHYLANHTSVLAVDRNMVVPEQRNQAIIINKRFTQPFHPITQVTQIFQNRKKFNKNATEEQYMAQFWQDMAQIRKKQILLHPAILIQKIFRGWIYRHKKKKMKEMKQNNIVTVKQFFSAWKRQIKFSKKLKLIFQKKNKEYLLLPLKQMKAQRARRKISQFAAMCKKKVLLRKMNLRCEYKFFNVLKSNQQALKSLYHVLYLEESSYIMIHIQGFQEFKKYVIPVVQSMNVGKEIKLEQNKDVQLRYLYEPPRKRRQFLRLLQLNEKSTVQLLKNNKNDKKKKQTYNHTILKCDANISKVYNAKNIHFSKKQEEEMKSIDKSFQMRDQVNLGELKKFSGDKQTIKDAVRGIYFYNMGYLTNCVAPTQKINILSQYSIKRISSILMVQKMWKGRLIRRKIQKFVRAKFVQQRAAIKIQRWFRNLASNHRKIFMLDTIKMLRTFNTDTFYIDIHDYFQLIKKFKRDSEYNQQKKLTFPEQNFQSFIHIESKKLLLSWDFQEPSHSSFINHRMGKKFFNNYFMQKVFEKWQFPGPIKYMEQKYYQKCEISHLFHYKTQISTLNKKNITYLEVKCASKYDVRLRVLGLKLFNYKFNKKQPDVTILPKQCVISNQVEQSYKRPIKNQNSIFLAQSNSHLQIQPISYETSRTFQFASKFYTTDEIGNQKPEKLCATLKIIMINSENRQVLQLQPSQFQTDKRKARSMSYNQKFDVSNFLISETSEIKLDQEIRQRVNQRIYPNLKKQSLKNVKIENKLKNKNRQKYKSQHYQLSDHKSNKFNFMLGDPTFHERLTTQPDLFTQERSLGSINQQDVSSNKNMNKLESILKTQNSREKSSGDPRILTRKKVQQNDEQKNNLKNMQSFTKNFINQGNFIQNQFLYGQIKRLKTQIQRNSMDQAVRIRTEQNERIKSIERFKQQKQKRAQDNHLKHKQQLFKSVIQRKVDSESVMKRKKEKEMNMQNNYQSLPKKMRINFAQQCYPIIGKHQGSNIMSAKNKNSNK